MNIKRSLLDSVTVYAVSVIVSVIVTLLGPDLSSSKQRCPNPPDTRTDTSFQSSIEAGLSSESQRLGPEHEDCLEPFQ
jgi:hypothetical protein